PGILDWDSHGGVIDWAVESLQPEVIKEMSSKMITCFPVDIS
ncbi:7216_t:CDS:1, partial [Gigaspora margarita]